MQQYLADSHSILYISDIYMEMFKSMWLKAESSPHKYQCVQPSYCPFAIWDTPLCKQLSADREE